MPSRITRKSKQTLVAQTLEKYVIYPFASNIIINRTTRPSFLTNSNSSDYGQLCGYLMLSNINQLNGGVKIQHTVSKDYNSVNQTQILYLNLIVKSYFLNNNGVVIYREPTYTQKDYLTAFTPSYFQLSRISASTHDGNNLVGLFIYAYKENVLSDVTVDLAYLEQSVGI